MRPESSVGGVGWMSYLCAVDATAMAQRVDFGHEMETVEGQR